MGTTSSRFESHQVGKPMNNCESCALGCSRTLPSILQTPHLEYEIFMQGHNRGQQLNTGNQFAKNHQHPSTSYEVSQSNPNSPPRSVFVLLLLRWQMWWQPASPERVEIKLKNEKREKFNCASGPETQWNKAKMNVRLRWPRLLSSSKRHILHILPGYKSQELRMLAKLLVQNQFEISRIDCSGTLNTILWWAFVCQPTKACSLFRIPRMIRTVYPGHTLVFKISKNDKNARKCQTLPDYKLHVHPRSSEYSDLAVRLCFWQRYVGQTLQRNS